jgi:MFS transporter, SP family, solute carrier family 2 (myo-inositol transporter), member 13
MKSLEVSYPGLALVILTPILSSFVYGVDIGLTSFVLSMLRDPNNEDADAWWSSMASDHMGQGIFLSSMSLGALIGSHTLLVYLAHFISRRTEIRIALCLFFIGNIFNFSSGTILQRCPKWIGFSCLLLGRLLFGFGVGFVQHSSCIYMSEMCPANIRGTVVASKEASIVCGIIAGYTIGDLFSENPLEWASK